MSVFPLHSICSFKLPFVTQQKRTNVMEYITSTYISLVRISYFDHIYVRESREQILVISWNSLPNTF